jgi:hypothetical protein
VQRWEYLKITSQGMTWGNLNGMRPRGVVLFEGKLEGDTLAGKSRFGGIDFSLPDGSPPPSPSFSFKLVRKWSGSTPDRFRRTQNLSHASEASADLRLPPGHPSHATVVACLVPY